MTKWALSQECKDSLICCWILFARILLRIFASMFISGIGQQFSFFVASLSGFDIRVMVTSYNEFGSLPSSGIFWKRLSRIGVSASLNFWQNSDVKPSGPGFLFAGRFLDYSFDFLACDGFVIYGFYYVEVCSFYACFLDGFYHKWMLNFVKGFLCIY